MSSFCLFINWRWLMWMFVSNSSIIQNDGFHIDYSSLSVACSRIKLGIVTTCLLHLWPPTRTDFLMSQLLKAEAKLPTIIVLMNVSLTILVEFVHLAYKIGFHPVCSMPIVFVVKRIDKNSSDHLIGLTLENQTLTFCLWCGSDSDKLPGRLFPWLYITELWFYHNS